jgi:hypothetical protein
MAALRQPIEEPTMSITHARRGTVLLPAVAILLCGQAFGQAKSRITEVRVYRGQALVTREVTFEATPGAQEVTVRDLPQQIVPDSLYATGDDNLTVRGVRYRTSAVNEAPRPEVQALDQQIQDAQDDLARIQGDLAVIEAQAAYLGKLEDFVAPTAHNDLNRGALDAQQLINVSDFVLKGRKDVAAQRVTLNKEQRAATEQIALLQRKRAELTPDEAKEQREAVLFVEAAKAQAADLRLNYVVGNVSWTPAYVARLNGDRNKLVLEYHGVVTQMSGEDWTNVDLTLSTSQPNMVAGAPLLSPLWLSLRQGGAEGARGEEAAGAYNTERRQLEQQLRSNGVQQQRGVNLAPTVAAPAAPEGMPAPAEALPNQGVPDDTLGANVLAARLQNLEMAAPDDVVKAARKMRSGLAEGLAVDYPLTGKVSLMSRADQQMFRIALLNLPADFYYTSVPLLSDYVSQAAVSQNTTDTTLLPGPYNAYLDGAFAGRGELPLVARGESMTLGFGTETQLRVARELQDKHTEIKGGNKVLTLTYQVRLQNFMGKPVKVRVWDRLPQPPNDQVQITLVNTTKDLSTDALYVEQEKPRGLLRWDIELPAGSTGAKAVAFPFGFRLEFDRQFTIADLPDQVVQRMRKDLEALQELKR